VRGVKQGGAVAEVTHKVAGIVLEEEKKRRRLQRRQPSQLVLPNLQQVQQQLPQLRQLVA